MSKIRVVDIATIGLAVDRADIEDLRRVGKELSEAFEDIGFVFVKNHGVDEEMINDAREASKDYFLVYLKINSNTTINFISSWIQV